MDITNFMSWFIDQVVSIFTWVYSTLDSIKFMGTSLLKVSVTLMILIPLIGVVLTISRNTSVVGERVEKVKESRKDKTKNET